MTKVLMIIAPHDFRDEEYQHPYEEFKSAGFDVTTVSTVEGEIVGMLGGIVVSEAKLEAINVSDFDVVFFVGGSGSAIYFDNPEAHRVAKEAASNSKVLAAICIAPRTLARAGLLEGKKATVFKTEENISDLKDHGAEYTGKDVQIDGNIVTASGPSAARDLGKKIIDLVS